MERDRKEKPTRVCFSHPHVSVEMWQGVIIITHDSGLFRSDVGRPLDLLSCLLTVQNPPSTHLPLLTSSLPVIPQTPWSQSTSNVMPKYQEPAAASQSMLQSGTECFSLRRETQFTASCLKPSLSKTWHVQRGVVPLPDNSPIVWGRQKTTALPLKKF